MYNIAISTNYTLHTVAIRGDADTEVAMRISPRTPLGLKLRKYITYMMDMLLWAHIWQIITMWYLICSWQALSFTPPPQLQAPSWWHKTWYNPMYVVLLIPGLGLFMWCDMMWNHVKSCDKWCKSQKNKILKRISVWKSVFSVLMDVGESVFVHVWPPPGDEEKDSRRCWMDLIVKRTRTWSKRGRSRYTPMGRKVDWQMDPRRCLAKWLVISGSK
jgi:hypothetical protein